MATMDETFCERPECGQPMTRHGVYHDPPAPGEERGPMGVFTPPATGMYCPVLVTATTGTEAQPAMDPDDPMRLHGTPAHGLEPGPEGWREDPPGAQADDVFDGASGRLDAQERLAEKMGAAWLAEVEAVERHLEKAAEEKGLASWRDMDDTEVAETIALLLRPLERAVNEEIATRDEYHEKLDQFAYAVAPQQFIGEHSSGNDPWANALEILVGHGPLIDNRGEQQCP